ncbi:activity-regulated cytoskeleton associated protein 2-like [Aricia agestis]|uniref:activity-regulated cytoskeleton associated protein 2-like n=1 Tax=Aricia agestis TaxID=91739 RepID=UPI001C2047FC|nr:activity-regulated cytoskeleton associated protein 2-like [Aricia agestis]
MTRSKNNTNTSPSRPVQPNLNNPEDSGSPASLSRPTPSPPPPCAGGARVASPLDAQRISVPTPTPAASAGNFAGCTARYSGAPQESLDAFIDVVESYKDCTNISDGNAVLGLSMLLTLDAATWWQGFKATVTSWDDALRFLRSAFGDRHPPHRIHRELFSNPQTGENTELYISKARALLARLPPGDLSEKVKLDMIYGPLHTRTRQRLRRFASMETLLKK